MADKNPHSSEMDTWQASSKPEHRSSRTVQNVILIWLDQRINELKPDFKKSLARLREIIRCLEIFQDVDECFDYIKSIEKCKAFMIVSGAIGQKIVQQISDTIQLEIVYVFCDNVTFHSTWAKDVPKIRGVYKDIEILCKEIIADRNECEESAISIVYNSLDPMFLYTQLLKEAILGINDDLTVSLNEFEKYCQSLNIIDSQELDEFIKDYSKHTPVWWYTAEKFIYPMVNRSLYDMDTELIQSMSFFIHDLHNQIEQIFQEKHRKTHDVLKLYRGQNLTIEAFDEMKQAKGDLMSFNNFLSTSRSREVSIQFARRGATIRGGIGVLFHMTVDSSICDQANTPFASVEDLSVMGHSEQEILFTTHTIFRIHDIQLIEDKENVRIYQIDITLVGNHDEKFRQIADTMRREVEESTRPGWPRFAIVLLKLDKPEQSLAIFDKLMDDASDDWEEHESAFYMGYAYKIKGDHSKAIECYEKAINIKKKTAAEDDHALANSYVNLGGVYFAMGDFKRALEYYEKVLNIKKRSLPDNHIDLASAYMNIGVIYKKMGDYHKAFGFYQKDLQIKKACLSEYHPDLATSYYNFGLLLEDQGKFSESLKYLKLSLDIRKRVFLSHQQPVQKAMKAVARVSAKLK